MSDTRICISEEIRDEIAEVIRDLMFHECKGGTECYFCERGAHITHGLGHEIDHTVNCQGDKLLRALSGDCDEGTEGI